jgi:hypothetical protein
MVFGPRFGGAVRDMLFKGIGHEDYHNRRDIRIRAQLLDSFQE